jgi:hypothetical protein
MPLPRDVGEMTSPVRCRHCGKVYDLGRVEIVSRRLDCSVWHCPGCNLQVDDRGESGWTGRKDYDRLERVTGGVDIYGRPLDPFGCPIGWDD